jgi:Polysaccharide deacetylase
MTKLLVLNYHGLFENSPNEFNGESRLMAIPAKSFSRQIQLIREFGIDVISLGDMWKRDHQDLLVAITFDDGFSSDHLIAAPLLKDMHYPATFFRSVNQQMENDADQKGISSLLDLGFEIGSHGMNHKDLTRLRNADLHYELCESKRWFKQEIGVDTQHLSAPYGRVNERVRDAAVQAEYKAVFTTGATFNTHKDRNLIVHRYNVTMSTDEFVFKNLLLGQLPNDRYRSIKSFLGKFISPESVNYLRQRSLKFSNLFQ